MMIAAITNMVFRSHLIDIGHLLVQIDKSVGPPKERSVNREKRIARVTLTGSTINLALVIFKFVSGILGHSAAMVADAIHSLSDLASDIIILLCIRISSKPEDDDHAYGHSKFETLASVCIGMILLLTGLGFLWESAREIAAFVGGEKIPVPGNVALVAAIVSLAAKEGLYHYTLSVAKRIDSDTLRANAWHHRSDALSSLATLFGIGGAILLGGKWAVLDPLAACAISLFIIGVAISLMKPGIDELMERSLPANEKREMEKIISSVPGVLGFHNLRTRRIGANRAVEVHIQLLPEIPLREAHDIATEIEQRIKKRFGAATHTGIHMEPVRDFGEKRKDSSCGGGKILS